jgi:hypothetical protein
MAGEGINGSTTRDRPRTAVIIALSLVGGVVAGIGFGWHASASYWNAHAGNWRIGLHTFTTGLAHGAPGAIGVAASLLVAGLVLREVGPQLMAAFSTPWRVRRYVLGLAVWLLILTGALIGAGAGYAYQSDQHDPAIAVLVGLLSALGSWVIAALISLLVEMANSLRSLASPSVAAPAIAPGAKSNDASSDTPKPEVGTA